MKKFLLSLVLMAFAANTMTAQSAVAAPQVKKECCKDHKDGQPCTKPADQQCDDCKAKAAEAKKHECKKAEGQKCEKAAGMKHECKKAKGQKCEKAEGMKHECKKAEGKQCAKEAAAKKHECKDHKDGQPCTKPADQQCDDCKAAAKKN